MHMFYSHEFMKNHTKVALAFVLSFVLLGTGCGGGDSSGDTATGDTWQRFVNSSGQTGDYFGSSLAISADGLTIVVGEKQGVGADHVDQGAVYVYTRSGSSWSLAAKLTAASGADDDFFGDSVAVSSNGSVVAVGAWIRDLNANNSSGAVYVFERPVAGWADATETACLSVNGTPASYELGVSVAISGDGSVIAAGADQYYSLSGAVYIYVRSGGNWASKTEDAVLTQSDSTSNTARFGKALGMSTDGSTLVVGSEQLETIYVFNKPGTGWATSSTPDAKLTASDGNTNNKLGSVAISADGSTIAGGASRPNHAGGGSVYVYVKPGTGWVDATENVKVQADVPADYDYFGAGVALNADGSSFMAGSGTKDKVYVFDRPEGGWTGSIDSVLMLEPEPEVLTELYFGGCLAINGNRLLVGAARDDRPNTDQGSFYIFPR